MMKDNFGISIYSDTTGLVKRQDRQLGLVNNILATRKLSDLLNDKNRIAKAIDLAVNARYNLDPFCDPYEINAINREALIEEIFISLKTFDVQKNISSLFNVDVPKNKISSRNTRYYNIKDYSIRFLLSMLLHEKINFSENIFGGKSEVFTIDDGSIYENERKQFQSIQNSMLLSGGFDWIVYVDISSYYDNIKLDILIEIIAKKLGVEENDRIIQLAKCYFTNITIGCWCDNFLQNIYFNDLDAVLNAHDWVYYRMTDDFRIFCKSKAEAELAYEIIKTELQKLKLSINRSKHFVVKPMTSVERFAVNREDYEYADLSPILELSKVSEYSVENVFNLSRDSEGHEWISHKYENQFPRKFTYRDELLEMTGFQINGTDVKEIFLDLDQKKIFTTNDYNVLFQIIFNTYSSYQFKNRVIKLFLNQAFSNNEDPQVQEIIISVFKKLASEYKNGSQSYVSYVFLNILFIKGSISSSQLLMYRKDIWNWMFEMIINNSYKASYLLRVVRYIVEHKLFELIHKTHGELLSNDKFWGQIIEKEAELKKGDLKYKYSYNINTIYFLEGLFTKSDLINLKRADYYFKKEEYGLALDYFLLLLKTNELNEKYFEIAYCYNHNKIYDQALKYYSLYINKHRSSGAYNNRALIYQHLKKYDEALADFGMAIELEETVRYFENRASCFMELRQYKSALNDLDRAIELKEANDTVTHSYVYRKRAKVKKELGDIDGAIAEIEHYCKLHYYGNPDTTANFIKELLEDKLDY